MNETASVPVVRIRGVKKAFGNNRVLDGVDLDVHKGEAVVVIGPSGSGKTTLLRCINLLETYDEGSIQVDGVYHHQVTPEKLDALLDALRRD